MGATGATNAEGKLNGGWSKWATGLAGIILSALLGLSVLLWQNQTMTESFRRELRENDKAYQRELRESDNRYIEARFEQREEIEQRREDDANSQLRIMLDIRQREMDAIKKLVESLDGEQKALHRKVLEYDNAVREEVLKRVELLRDEIAKFHASPSPGGGE